MSAITCTRRIQFCAGHRVFGHESKCSHLHGHNYVVFLHARRKEGGTDRIGRVIDFSVLKDRVGTWIDEHWDHGFILDTHDGPAAVMLQRFNPGPMTDSRQKVYLLPINPTAEGLAEYMLLKVCPEVLHDTDVEVFKVVMWETENCFATVELGTGTVHVEHPNR